MHDRVLGVAGCEQHRRAGLAPRDLVGELPAVHAARRRSMPSAADRSCRHALSTSASAFDAVCVAEDVVYTEPPGCAIQIFAHQIVILDHEDRLLAANDAASRCARTGVRLRSPSARGR